MAPHPRKSNYRHAVPGPRKQMSIRFTPDMMESIEERALEESLRLGVNVAAGPLIRKAVTHYLETVPLPPRAPVKPPCGFTETAGGKAVYCVTCNQGAGKRRSTVYCKNLGRRVKIEL